MTEIIEIETERLKLRQWQETDRSPFAELNGDSEVMKYFPSVWSEVESNKSVDKVTELIKKNGWGFWAIETLKDNKFIGFAGLNQPEYQLPVDSCVEIGWRLARESWGKGYATEAGKACLDFAFQNLVLEDVYSFTATSNRKSIAVMQRLNMVNTGILFDHPLVPDGSPLKQHVLYKIELAQWKAEKH